MTDGSPIYKAITMALRVAAIQQQEARWRFLEAKQELNVNPQDYEDTCGELGCAQRLVSPGSWLLGVEIMKSTQVEPGSVVLVERMVFK